MISDNEIIEIGRLVKPHGINGEIVSVTDLNPASLKCIVIKIDGINVPFFLDAIRPKGNESFLLTIDGIDSENDAASLCGKNVYALKHDIIEDESDEDGFYANDLIGFVIMENGCLIGEVVDIEDSTENALFITKRANGDIVYIPIADEFITEISVDTKTIEMNLPTGILEL